MRLNVEEEQSIAFAIRDAEKAAWDAVAAVGSRPPNKGRTRAAQVRALEIAVEQLMLRSFKEPALKPAANAARRAWNEAETQHWNLAMSAERIARGEAKKLGGMLLSQEDLEQEGHIGLLRAARRFDPDLGIRFSTYARWWVRAQMTRAMETSGRTIRVPGGAVEQLRNLRNAAERFERAQVDYKVEDLAAEVGIEPERARELLSIVTVTSSDQEDDDGLRLGDQLEDKDTPSPDDVAVVADAVERIQSMVDELTDRERFILLHHFGLLGHEPRTMAEIGKTIGLSRERVRQIERAAIERLRVQLNQAAA